MYMHIGFPLDDLWTFLLLLLFNFLEKSLSKQTENFCSFAIAVEILMVEH